ncbi:MAG: hypothetical protein LIO77_09690 [Rikenellaceae bacterium]|nr:hypothetical protein [Rikenellaceae bacterium]
MAVLNDCIYKNLALILTERIGEDEFFNGSVRWEGDGVGVTLRTTLLVYRTEGSPDKGRPGFIKKIVPVWWECEPVENGKPAASGFSWEEFKNFLPSNG